MLGTGRQFQLGGALPRAVDFIDEESLVLVRGVGVLSAGAAVLGRGAGDAAVAVEEGVRIARRTARHRQRGCSAPRAVGVGDGQSFDVAGRVVVAADRGAPTGRSAGN